MINDGDDQLQDVYMNDNNYGGSGLSFALQELKKLSIVSKVYLVCALALVIFLFAVDWVGGTVFTLCSLATCIPLGWWWRENSYRCPLDLVVRSFARGAGLMAFSVSVTLHFIFAPIAKLIGGVFLLQAAIRLATFVGVEELHKVLFARLIKRGVELNRETKTHQIAYTATSIGYATTTAFLWALVLDLVFDSAYKVKHDSVEDLGFGVISMLLACGFGIPLHVLSGYLIGLETSKQTPILKAGRVSFLVRCAFLYSVFIAVYLSTVIGWFLAVCLLMASTSWICWAFLKHIKHVEQTLPVEYLARVGYLNAFGYGVLPDADDMALTMEIPANAQQLV